MSLTGDLSVPNVLPFSGGPGLTAGELVSGCDTFRQLCTAATRDGPHSRATTRPFLTTPRRVCTSEQLRGN